MIDMTYGVRVHGIVVDQLVVRVDENLGPRRHYLRGVPVGDDNVCLGEFVQKAKKILDVVWVLGHPMLPLEVSPQHLQGSERRKEREPLTEEVQCCNDTA